MLLSILDMVALDLKRNITIASVNGFIGAHKHEHDELNCHCIDHCSAESKGSVSW